MWRRRVSIGIFVCIYKRYSTAWQVKQGLARIKIGSQRGTIVAWEIFYRMSPRVLLLLFSRDKNARRSRHIALTKRRCADDVREPPESSRKLLQLRTKTTCECEKISEWRKKNTTTTPDKSSCESPQRNVTKLSLDGVLLIFRVRMNETIFVLLKYSAFYSCFWMKV